MLSRWSLGLLISLLAHLGVVVIGLAMGARAFTGPVEVEIAGVNLEEVKDLPLGGPENGEGKARAAARARSRAPQPPPADGTLTSRPGKDDKTAGSSPSEDDAAPAPTSDLGAYGPQGSRLTVLMRLDRLRGTDYAPHVDELLMRLPDRRDFVSGTGLDMFMDFDAFLVATPNPLDPSVTFLAVRHRMDDAKVRAALNQGAKASGHALTWRTQGGRPIAERHAREGGAPRRDDRLIILAAPGLTVVTPRAYRALLLAPASPAPDGGVSDGTGGKSPASPDGGAPTPAVSPLKGGWATLLTRIDAEEGLMPPDGAVMVNAVDIFKSRAPAPGEPPVLYGMPIPAAINAVIGIADAPYLDVVAEFKTDAPAKHWESQWPTVQRKLRTHPLLVLSGFSSLVTRAQLEREGRAVHLRLAVSHDETMRLLAIAARFLASRYGDAPQYHP